MSWRVSVLELFVMCYAKVKGATIITLFFVRLWVQCANPGPNRNLFVRLWVQCAKLSPNHNLICCVAVGTVRKPEP